MIFDMTLVKYTIISSALQKLIVEMTAIGKTGTAQARGKSCRVHRRKYRQLIIIVDYGLKYPDGNCLGAKQYYIFDL